MKLEGENVGEIKFNESLILKLSQESTDTEVLSALATHLQEQGIVKETYKDAVLAREKTYPTGLYTGNINVAIPHTDIVHVNEAAICVGILENPAKFCSMDDKSRVIDVSLVILLALTEPHGHVDMLQKVIELIQDQELIKKIIESDDTKEVFEIIKAQLL